MATGELDLFLEIYDECEGKSWVDGSPLMSPRSIFFHWQFSHIIPKGSYKKFRLDKRNILPMTREQHEQQTSGKHRDVWPEEKIKELDELYDDLRAEYHRRFIK